MHKDVTRGITMTVKVVSTRTGHGALSSVLTLCPLCSGVGGGGGVNVVLQ